jgi:hypothetical protein
LLSPCHGSKAYNAYIDISYSKFAVFHILLP